MLYSDLAQFVYMILLMILLFCCVFYRIYREKKRVIACTDLLEWIMNKLLTGFYGRPICGGGIADVLPLSRSEGWRPVVQHSQIISESPEWRLGKRDRGETVGTEASLRNVLALKRSGSHMCVVAKQNSRRLLDLKLGTPA